MPIVLKYGYFQTVCTQNNASVEWSYFARNASNFSCSHLHLRNFLRKKTEKPPENLLTGAGKGREEERIKGPDL